VYHKTGVVLGCCFCHHQPSIINSNQATIIHKYHGITAPARLTFSLLLPTPLPSPSFNFYQPSPQEQSMN
jgi:hypothetical protein